MLTSLWAPPDVVVRTHVTNVRQAPEDTLGVEPREFTTHGRPAEYPAAHSAPSASQPLHNPALRPPHTRSRRSCHEQPAAAAPHRGPDQTPGRRHGPHRAGPPSTQTPAAGRARRSFLLGGAAVLGLSATGASAWALDRFVIDHTEIDDVAAYETAHASSPTSSASTAAATNTRASIEGRTYTSSASTISIETVSTGSGSDTLTYYVADITLSDATALRSAFADNHYGTNITAKPTTIAQSVDAVFAVNGDYYGFRQDGTLIRNGVIYRDDGVRDGIALYRDGRAEIYDETTTDAQTLLDAGVWSTCSFGPSLVQAGAVIDGIDQVEVDTNVGNHSIQGQQPRTAIGWVDEAHYAVVVVDGRDKGYSRGATLPELAEIMVGLGCQCAYNLDGGGSSAMYFNGEIINQPSNGGERATSDILYVAMGA